MDFKSLRQTPYAMVLSMVAMTVLLFAESAGAQALVPPALKYVAVRVSGGSLYLDQFPTLAAFSAQQAPDQTEVVTWNDLSPRALTSDGQRWFAVLRKGSSGQNCFATYLSYDDLKRQKGQTLSCNTALGDGFRGVAYDGHLFYTLYWDGSKHTWRSHLTWDDVVANNVSGAMSDTRHVDIYKSIGFDPAHQVFFSVAQSSGSLYVLQYANFVDMATARGNGLSQTTSSSNQYVGLTPGQVAKTLDVYIVAGQSNAVGWDTIATDTNALPPDAADQNINFFYRNGNGRGGSPSTAIGKLGPQQALYRNQDQVNSFGPTNFGIEMGIGRTLYNAGWTNVAIVKVAFGGTTLAADWNPNDPGSLTQTLVTNLSLAAAQWNAAGYQTRLAGLFWMQGEYDARDQNMANAYQLNLTRFIGLIRGWSGNPRLPIILGRINNQHGWTYAATVQAAQDQVKALDPTTIGLVNTDGLSITTVPYTDTAHFSSASEYQLGVLMGNQFKTLSGW